VIFTNPPFGGKEGKDAQKNFAFESSATQVLFVQDILAELAPGGTCAIVLDEGLLFRTSESAFVETKRKLVDECELWAILSLPGGVFSTAGAGVKTNLLFFTKGRKTERIWYYDLSQVKVGKKTPLTLAHFGFAPDGSLLDEAALPAALVAEWLADEENSGMPFPSYARQLALRSTPKSESRWSWTVDFAARRAKARDDMRPLLESAASLRAEAVDFKEKLKRLKKERAADDVMSVLDTQIQEKEQGARDLEAQAASIDAAVFDLKAVNPNATKVVDDRTPAQIIDSVREQGRVVAAALDRLTALLS
jgi:type I restriction enzyme M protein